ncbi:hypothetical protein PHZ_c1567 [Phenylobacterium zucineum HLK1]|uniref:Uncharacterized protein n=1 Tax=Phenylobacterium zucineum (strain HLK1) TaxID=450851 RepID=B4RAH1_PHEZH|nr:hypothetical protein [Phenylobacterium zucineum]ACG77978.1 hypothetical protein PHZ_c1567 [Phenylobacterium zucineum HLK1]
MGGRRRTAASKDARGRQFARRLAAVQQVCERLEAGESLCGVCRDPLLPQRYQLDRWRAAEPLFDEMVREARRRAQDAGTWRRRANHPWSRVLEDEILRRIAAGRSLVEVCEAPEMPHHTSVTRWLDEKPGFRDRYLDARLAQADGLFDLAWRIAREADEDEVRTARLKVDVIKWRIGRLSPKRYGPAYLMRMIERAEAAAAAQAEAEAEAEAEDARELWIKRFERGSDGQVRVAYMFRARPRREPGEPLLLIYPDGDGPEPPRDPSHGIPGAFRADWEGGNDWQGRAAP